MPHAIAMHFISVLLHIIGTSFSGEHDHLKQNQKLGEMGRRRHGINQKRHKKGLCALVGTHFTKDRLKLASKWKDLKGKTNSDYGDHVMILNFPDRVIDEFDLSVGSRLLTVNTYSDGRKVVKDLIEGEGSFKRTANVYAVIADFVTDDLQRLNERKSSISEEEWMRCASLGAEYLTRFPDRFRNGIPRKSFDVA